MAIKWLAHSGWLFSWFPVHALLDLALLYSQDYPVLLITSLWSLMSPPGISSPVNGRPLLPQVVQIAAMSCSACCCHAQWVVSPAPCFRHLRPLSSKSFTPLSLTPGSLSETEQLQGSWACRVQPSRGQPSSRPDPAYLGKAVSLAVVCFNSRIFTFRSPVAVQVQSEFSIFFRCGT